MANEIKTYTINYTTSQFNDVLKRADQTISASYDEDGQFNQGYIDTAHGGIGLKEPEPNSVLIGGEKESNTIKTILSKQGAFYVDEDDGEPKYGTLPIYLGGTGVTTVQGLKQILGLTAGDENSGSDETVSIPISCGGTGVINIPRYQIMVGNDQEPIGTIPLSQKGDILFSNGSFSMPEFKSTTNITKLGNITTGTWNADIIDVSKGGTGVNNLDSLSNNLKLGSNISSPIPIDRGGTGVNNLNSLSNNLKLGENINSAIPTVRGGTGLQLNSIRELVSHLQLIYSDIDMTDTIIQSINGGTGVPDLTIANTNTQTVINPNYLISNISNIDSETLLASNNNVFIIVSDSISSITLPELTDNSSKYEIEIFYKSSNNLTIKGYDNNHNIYFPGGTSSKTSVKTLDPYAVIGIKYLGNKEWLITGGVE